MSGPAADGHVRQREPRALRAAAASGATAATRWTTVRRGFKDIRELQRYVDAQAGGPGKGFFQIVTNPFQARRVINKGKMAVVLEIEVSELFGCRGWDIPTCDRAQVDRQLDEFYRLGVRSSLLLNKFDNPLTGVRFDSGEVGVADQRRQPPERGLVLERRDLHRAPTHDNDDRDLRAGGRARSSTALLALLGVKQRRRSPPIRRRRTATPAG